MSHEKEVAANNQEQQPKKKRGKAPVIVPKHISDWARRGTNPQINNWKQGGGHKPWNGR